MASINIWNSNIGNDATALWRHYDDSVSEDFINKRQAMHVSILSVCSFLGRLASGKCWFPSNHDAPILTCLL